MSTTATNTSINSTTAKYCYIDFDINEHRKKLAFVAAFVDGTDSRYGFSNKDLRYLGGSELARIIDDQLISNDHEWFDKFKQQLQHLSSSSSSNNNTSCIDATMIRPPVYGNRIIVQLYWDIAPLACENFATLCCNGSTTPPNNDNKKGKIIPPPIGECGKPLAYRKCIVHRIVPNFIIQTGDFVFGNGSGGESIYNGKKFKDERSGLSLKHNKRGIVSMGNSGKNSNTSQFFITLNIAPQCDGKHVIFGEVISGWEILTALEQAGSISGEPIQPVSITDCGIWIPYNTPACGYWYDQPDLDSFSGISSTFIVRPRVAVIGPNITVINKFREVLYPSCSITSINAEEYNTSNSDGNDDSMTNYITELIDTLAIDVILVAPACWKGIASSIQQLPNKFIEAITNSTASNPITIDQVIIEAKPVEALDVLKTKSWFITYLASSLAWQMDGSL